MRTARKTLALILVFALMLTMIGPIAVSAASTDELVIEMVDGQLVIYKNGKMFKTYDANQATGIKLSRSAKTDKIVITFEDANGRTRNIALADDATISLAGTMPSVTLNKTLGDVAVTIAQTATVDTLLVKNSGAVEVEGEVKDVNVTTKAANISVADTAKVDTILVPKGVEVTGAGAGNVGTTTVKEDPKPATPPVAPPPISSGGDYNWQDIGGGYNPPTITPELKTVTVTTMDEVVHNLQDAAVGKVVVAANANVALAVDTQVPANKTLVLSGGATLTVPASLTLTVYGKFESSGTVVTADDSSTLAAVNGGIIDIKAGTLNVQDDLSIINGHLIVANPVVFTRGSSRNIWLTGVNSTYEYHGNKIIGAEDAYFTIDANTEFNGKIEYSDTTYKFTSTGVATAQVLLNKSLTLGTSDVYFKLGDNVCLKLKTADVALTLTKIQFQVGTNSTIQNAAGKTICKTTAQDNDFSQTFDKGTSEAT